MGSWLTMGSDPMARAWHALFSDRLVQRALAFIRAHYAEPIRPQDVVKELKVSRRLADLRFSAIQGESMGKAILRMRLEAVCRRSRHKGLDEPPAQLFCRR